jgi:hypothetical protein
VPPDLDGRRSVVNVGSSRAKSASQKPYSSSPSTDRKDEGSGDLLTRSLVHASDQTGEAMAAAQQQEEAKTLAQLDAFWRGR